MKQYILLLAMLLCMGVASAANMEVNIMHDTTGLLTISVGTQTATYHTLTGNGTAQSITGIMSVPVDTGCNTTAPVCNATAASAGLVMCNLTEVYFKCAEALDHPLDENNVDMQEWIMGTALPQWEQLSDLIANNSQVSNNLITTQAVVEMRDRELNDTRFNCQTMIKDKEKQINMYGYITIGCLAVLLVVAIMLLGDRLGLKPKLKSKLGV